MGIQSLDRFSVFAGVAVLTLVSLLLVVLSPWAWLGVAVFGALTAVGIHDVRQTRHSILRNYPVLGHMRFMFEGIRPEIRQYLIESDHDELPFSRDERSIVYQRAKGVEDKRPFGTRARVYDAGYEWLTHSVQPKHITDTDFRVKVGGPDCAQPYDASIYNISAMSFGALSSNAILALNKGARAGRFAHDT
ncbi:MAG: FMN-binding glutamate synthase family protein, partial [Rhodobacteraceae bacterium]|nr:FMN-binding glutamate synthase family protein [Paracoccaceae bacterium]